VKTLHGNAGEGLRFVANFHALARLGQEVSQALPVDGEIRFSRPLLACHRFLFAARQAPVDGFACRPSGFTRGGGVMFVLARVQDGA
jgi:hypothetical protein